MAISVCNQIHLGRNGFHLTEYRVVGEHVLLVCRAECWTLQKTRLELFGHSLVTHQGGKRGE
jgi:hypothetical protein